MKKDEMKLKILERSITYQTLSFMWRRIDGGLDSFFIKVLFTYLILKCILISNGSMRKLLFIIFFMRICRKIINELIILKRRIR